MLRTTMVVGMAMLLLSPGAASAQEVQEQPNGAPLFGALVGGLIGGAVGAALARKGAHGRELVPAVGGAHPAAVGAHPGGGKMAGAPHKGAGAPMHRKPQ